MTTCILAIIKNEHLYLDEWIKYHLSIGVSHIFIFEDIKSKSHSQITNQFQQVTLQSVLDIVDEKEKEEIIDRRRKFEPEQDRYITNGLAWIKKHYVYDWCFAIDADEFITAERPLSAVITDYKDYDAVVLQWQNFNANGIVRTPSYKDKGIIETYTQKCGYAEDNQQETTKVAYNLHSWQKDFYERNHYPSDKCKWCKPDFSTDIDRAVYEDFYIRHYICKSWEEYVMKLRVRGMFHLFHRHYEGFFEINPDLKPRQEELEAMAKDIIKEHGGMNY